MQSLFIVDRDFLAGSYIPSRKEQNVTVDSFHISGRVARMIDVVRAVAPTRAIQAPPPVDVTDAQDAPVARAPARFKIRNSLTRVFGNLSSAREPDGGEASLSINRRTSN